MPDRIYGSSSDWKTWDAQAWSRALFDRFFVSAGPDAAVSRLAITPDELAKATRNTSVEPAAARNAFLTAIRCSPSEFRSRLSLAGLARGAWKGDAPPPFLAHLLFTCFAAASLDTGTVNEGDFRERLRVLLKHPHGTRYPLGDLPHLWIAFARWLEKRRREGDSYRALILPDPGWMSRIGYSVRLAFPPRADRLYLVKLLRGTDWGTAPTVHEALQLIGRQVSAFSAGFREVFARARRAYVGGRDAPELEALWSAVLEASSLANPVPSNRPARPRYQLFLEMDELLQADPVLVASAQMVRDGGTVIVIRLDEPLGEYQFLVRTAADGSTTQIVRLLLLGTLSTSLPHLNRSAVNRAIEQGVLLFRRNDDRSWELAESRPEEGTARALVRDTLSKPFAALLRAKELPRRKSKFDGWLDIGPFELALLEEPTEERSPRLANVRCLQRTRVGAQITLAGGVRLEGGYLGIRGLFPAVRCPGVSEVTVFQMNTANDAVRTTPLTSLARSLEEPDAFEFDPEQADLDGSYNLVAMRNVQVIASREIVFQSRVLGHDYATATEKGRWIVEGASADTLPADSGTDCFLGASPENADRTWFARDRASSSVGRGHGDSIVEELSVDDDPRLDRFVEVMAAICTRRKGIAESEFLELLEKVVGVDVGQTIWDVARAWLEGGYLDVLSRRHWRGRVYFARHPRLVVTQSDGEPRVVLHGLAPHGLRARARIVLGALGAIAVNGRTVSRAVAPAQMWVVKSIAVAEAATRELGLSPVEFVRDPSQFTTPLESLITTTHSFPRYERQGIWDWELGGFRKRRVEGTEGVRIEWHTRQDGPDLYVVIRADGTLWSTRARNWALLIGYLCENREAFASSGATMLIRTFGFGPYVPLPVARAITLRSHVTSGPIEHPSHGRGYAYEFASTLERKWLEQWLHIRRDDTAVRRRLTWFVAALSDGSRPADCVVIPSDLRRRLDALVNLPEAAALISRRRIPRRMLPHLRRNLGLVGA